MLKKYWNIFIQTGIWICGLVSSLIIAPNLYEYDNFPFAKITQFIAAAMCGLMYVLIKKYNLQKDIKKWWLSSILFFALGITAIIFYEYHYDLYTVNYANSKTVKGDEIHLDSMARIQRNKYFQKYNYRLSDEEMVEKAAGKTDKLWESTFLKKRRIILFVEYGLPFFFLTIFLISMIQSIYLTKKYFKAD